jgi:hypothetical protein
VNLSMLVARVVRWIYIVKGEWSNAADLDRGRPVGPSEVMYAAWHPDEAPAIDLTAGRVELVAHTGAELSAKDRTGSGPLKRNRGTNNGNSMLVLPAVSDKRFDSSRS